MNKQKKIEYPDLESLELTHNNLLRLTKESDIPKTIADQRKILQLQLKGLEYFEGLYSAEELINSQEFLYSDNIKNKLTRIGMELEKKEFLKENNADVLLKTETHLKLESLTEELEDILGLNKLKLQPPKPTPENKKDDVDIEDKLEIDNPSEIKTQINEEVLAQELTQRAKMDGDLKEVKLNSTPTTENGQVAASLVVDLDVKKIENTIEQMNEKINPKKPEEVKKEPEKTKDNIKESDNKNNPIYKQNKSNLPKPKPEFNNDKEKDKKIEPPKPSPAMVANQVIELAKKLREQQENNPTVIDKEKFETVLKPQIPLYKDKKIIANNIFAMRERSLTGPTLDVVENQYGTEERRKSKLK